MDPNTSAWYFPVASPAWPYTPRGLSIKTLRGIQDLLLLDARSPELARLPALALADCTASSVAAATRPQSARRKRRGSTEKG